jgi:NAD(P)-dependent dehydrogenase (short-subunit alcohol dehydrogenase family)
MLAAAGAQVVMAARNREKASDAGAAVRAEHPDRSVEIVALDLGNLSSVGDAAASLLGPAIRAAAFPLDPPLADDTTP